MNEKCEQVWVPCGSRYRDTNREGIVILQQWVLSKVYCLAIPNQLISAS